MANAFIQVGPDGKGKRVDNSPLLDLLGNTVYRQRTNISDPTDFAGIAKVVNALPGPSTYGLTVWLAQLANLRGTWNYKFGNLQAAGNVTGVGRCLHMRINAIAADATLNINGGNTITVRSGQIFELWPLGNLVAPTVNWVSGNFDSLIEGIT